MEKGSHKSGSQPVQRVMKRSPGLKAIWLSRAKGTYCAPSSRRRDLRMLPSQRTCEAREVNRLSAALSGSM